MEMVMQRLEGRAALVTGGASGMGKASAIRLAADGASIVIGDINTDGANETAEMIRAAGGKASVVGYDAMEEDACVNLVRSAAEELGRLDIVANVAGITAFYRLEEMTAALFNRFITINLTSTMVICREAMPHLKKTRGCMINFASINARVNVAYHAAYDASKAGVLAVTKSIAQEFVADGVRCNAICPGGVDTPMNENLRMPEGMDFELIRKLVNPHIPFGKAEEIASVVAFLASDDASYINGEQIVVDGGLTSMI
ncbi:MAG: meso-butanediol dehydrogenase/(S,S)-butanediol dehydrogenase/diacetyl reductase [Myxococcota bacterium]|jgi:meso-butanediol dehydrogenase/(S,S)-butanediol dehydrogenase/diacetyl reductase